MKAARFKHTRFPTVMSFEAFTKLNIRCQEKQTFPENCKVPTVSYFAGKGANLLTATAIFWLKSEGYFASRQNSTGSPMKTKDGQIKWKPATGMKGAGDIYAIVEGGRSLWIEIKLGSDRQSEAQMKFEKAVTDQGALYWIIRSFDDLLTKLDELQSNPLRFSASTVAENSTIYRKTGGKNHVTHR